MNRDPFVRQSGGSLELVLLLARDIEDFHVKIDVVKFHETQNSTQNDLKRELWHLVSLHIL